MKFGFLPVGHTHEDVDQLFSCISRQLKHTNALTIQGYSSTFYCYSPSTLLYYCIELKSVIQQSFTPRPETVEVDEVYDVKEWMTAHTPNLHDHLKAHQFKFEKNEQGHSKVFYKEWSIDPFWLPHSGISLLIPYELSLVPVGKPLVILPAFDSDILDKLAHTIEKIKGYLQTSGVDKWWSKWMVNAKKCTQECSPKPAGMFGLVFAETYPKLYNHPISCYQKLAF